MRVLLLRPPDPRIERFSLWMPLGLASLASAIRERHEVTILDAPLLGLDVEAATKRVLEIRPDVLGVSLLTLSLYPAGMLCRRVKEVAPEVVTVVGGPHPSGDPHGTLPLCEAWDYAFQGEAEQGFSLFLDRLEAAGSPGRDRSSHPVLEPSPRPALIRKKKEDWTRDIPGLIRRVNGGVEITPAAFASDLDALPHPAWDLLDLPAYPRHSFFFMGRQPNAHLYATRGCPSSCVFCGIRGVSGPGFRTRSVESVLHEVHILQARYGVQTLMFVDDNLTADRDYALALFDALAGLPSPVHWIPIHGLRLDTLDEELVRAMDRSGCLLFYAGIESGSPRILERMGKGTTLEEIESKVRLVRRVSRIQVCGYFVLGFPGETREDALRSIRFARKLQLDRALFLPNLLSPGSEQWRRLVTSGRMPALTLEDFEDPIGLGYRLIWEFLAEKDGLSPRELRRLFEKAYASFYLRPGPLSRLPFQVSPRGVRDAARWVSRYFA